MVDSGNLVGNLLVLGSGCAELCEACILPPRMFGGLRDTLRVLLDVARGTKQSLVDADVLRKIERQIEDLAQAPATVSGAHALLSRLIAVAEELTAAAGHQVELAWWANAYARSCRDHQTDLKQLAYWLVWPAPPTDSGTPEPTIKARPGTSCVRRSITSTPWPPYGMSRKCNARRSHCSTLCYHVRLARRRTVSWR